MGMGYDVIEGMMSLKGPCQKNGRDERLQCAEERRDGEKADTVRKGFRNVCVQVSATSSLLNITHLSSKRAGSRPAFAIYYTHPRTAFCDNVGH